MVSKLLDCFNKLLRLSPVEDSSQPLESSQVISRIIVEYQVKLENDNESIKSGEDLEDYIDWALPKYFNIDIIDDNFIVKENEDNWTLFLQLIITNNEKELIIKKCLLQIIIALIRVSFINKQKIGKCLKFQNSLKDTLFTKDSEFALEESLRQILNTLYTETLSVSSTIDDLLNLYDNFTRSKDIINTLALQTTETLSQSYFLFQNSYKIFSIKDALPPKSKSIAIRLYLQLNNVTSNRIMTIGCNLFFEIKEGQLFLSDDESIIGLFDSFEFKPLQIYSLLINIEGTDITLYNDGILINKLQLFDGAISNLAIVELGSMMSSFKVFRFQIFSGIIDDTVATLLHQAGSTYYKSSCYEQQLYGLDYALRKATIVKAMQSTPNGNLESSFLNFSDDSLIIDLNPNFELANINEDNYIFIEKRASTNNENNVLDSRPIYYYKSSNLVSNFEAVDCFSQIIKILGECSNFEEVYELLNHLIKLLNDYRLRYIFEKDFGFPIIKHILLNITIPTLKKTLPLPILNLFLEFCGWDISDVENSIIKNESAYDNIILDLKLWYAYSDDNEQTLIGQEILRFILFQITTQVDASIFSSYNLKVMQKLYFIQKLSNSQHLIGELFPTSNVLFELKQDLVNIYYTLIKRDISRFKLKYIFNFAFYEIKQGFFVSGDILLKSLEIAINDTIENNDIKGLVLIYESLPTKDILLVLQEIIEKKENPIIPLRIILKLLASNSSNLENFGKRSGFKVLLEVLKGTEFLYYEEIILLLFFQSFEDFDYIKNSPSVESFVNCTISFKKSIALKDILELSIRLLEWAVINDIEEKFEVELPDFIYSFISQLDTLMLDTKNVDILDVRTSNILNSLSDLLLTMTKPQNGNVYEKSSNLLQNLISKTLKYNIISMNTKNFEQYIQEFFYLDVAFTQKFAIFSGNKHPYYLYINIEKYFIEVVYELLAMDVKFSLKLMSSPFMFPNIITIFSAMIKNYVELDFSTEFYLASLSILLICLRICLTDDKYDQKTISNSELVKLVVHLVVKLQALVINKRLEWDDDFFNQYLKLLLKYNDILFENTNEILSSNIIWLIFIFIGYNINAQQINTESLDVIGSILTSCEQNQEYILNELEFKGRKDLLSIINLFKSAKNEEAISLLKKNKDRLLTEKQCNKFLGISFQILNVTDFSRNISTTELNNIVFKSKQEDMDRNFIATEKLYKIFLNSLVEKRKLIIREGDKEVKGFLTDCEEEYMINRNEYKEIIFKNSLILDAYNSKYLPFDWSLDDIEDFQKSKRKLVRVPNNKKLHEDDQSREQYSLRKGKENREDNLFSDSLNSYEVISNISFENENDYDSTEENHKILKVLKPKDSIKGIWNCSRIIGLEVKEGILIYGLTHMYFIQNYFFSKSHKNIVNISKAPIEERDINIELIGNSPKSSVFQEHEVVIWENSSLIHVTQRPFLLRDVAFELFYSEGKSNLFSFNNKDTRDEVYSRINKNCKSFGMDPMLRMVLDEINKRNSGVGLKNGISQTNLRNKVFNVLNTSTFDGFEATQLWVKGEISNFYYLMILNTLAGRSFNDLTQYPVFPWIISDCVSDTISLKDKNIYRDLSKPMGAQTEKRAAQFKERYESLESLKDPLSPPFHYGTHYSSSMIVSSYLIRLRPFVDSYLLLQSGKFGPADRLFNSIERAWCSASSESTTDVRELIPEFFCLPEFLINVNKLNFGKDQKNTQIDNVSLPKWANGDPTVFIWKNREALESEYVSENLHHWIDLIFGYKQKGPAAISSINVFNKVSYPGAVNLDNIDDPNEKRAITGMIHNFGQTPLQIFSEPHPKRSGLKPFQLTKSILALNGTCSVIKNIEPKSQSNVTRFIKLSNNSSNNSKWQSFPKTHLPAIGGFDVILDNKFRTSLTIGNKVFSYLHDAPITEINGEGNSLIFTGDDSGLIKIWKLDTENSPSIKNISIFRGHRSTIKQIEFYYEYRVIISLDISGMIILWDVKNLRLIRYIKNSSSILAISQGNGDIAVVSKNNTVSFQNINGSNFCNIDFKNHIITSIEFFNISSLATGQLRHVFWQEKDVILIGFEDGIIEIYVLYLLDSGEWSLKLLKVIKSTISTPITSIKPHLNSLFVDDYEKNNFVEIIAGDSNGDLYIWS
ncbi:hypothetical protein TPHA_0E03510 [Tetrapisispora phaffii CBS 4417]|uniref:Beige protein homolog 1 n=1 Tax=Tetrapisispora phaffii (strain ATCC 24235 / CBS 4417 / NBRC 1672 / NRRL Y-8282 / UCD 70-5) TaxID=1071381 RepID=G8BU63_TETPH|nr:hypothetical protein TPHA_0E03510 [Tetrapisispora phaffii CBS 4417]CCE63441.1 hypothetical protein TPHA_0E03510 [Tetrapisispora phaffii CBS 4417]